jgi:hypothetical protein
MRVYDPRLDTSPGAHPSDKQYYVESRNPALIAADLAPHEAFADEVVAFWKEVAKAAEYCDEVVPEPMTEARAREILGDSVRPDNTIDPTRSPIGWVQWNGDADWICIDASLELEQLEALAWWMRNKGRL